jgi:riboflavin transporter FmnP
MSMVITINLLPLIEKSYLMTSGPSGYLEKQIIQLPKSREIAAIGLFSAFSIILTIISNLVLKLAFIPPVSYLLFDFGEIPVIICFLLVGPRGGFCVAAVEFFALNLLPTSTPLIGPLFKFMSVSITLLGLWIGFKVLRSRSFKSKMGASSVFSAILRSVGMTLPNAAWLVYSFHFVPFSSLLYYTLELTAVFNILQIPFDLLPTYIILDLPQMKHILRKNGMTWFESGVRRTAVR